MQFMSQSMGWADNIVLAMAPLGIITVIVSAIRVGGPSWLKAVIGRARENLAVAEADLMSSTSKEVCELWNGQEVVRCMGSAPVSEFICLLPEDMPRGGNDAKIVTSTLEKAVVNGYLEKIVPGENFDRKHTSQGPPNDLNSAAEEGKASTSPEIIIVRNTAADAPNISLNSHDQSGRGELRLVAVIGTILQLGVLTYSGFATYYLKFPKDESPIAGYAFPCTAAGTLVLVAGMLLCAHVLESSTEEKRYRPGQGKETRLVWLQQTKTVSDQVFASFAVFATEDRMVITTSHRADKQSQAAVLVLKTVIGTTVSLCGFVVQFIGLRGMHWSASVAQLGAVLVMTGFRAWVRRGLAKPPGCQPLVSEFELDWFAKTLGDIENAPWRHVSTARGMADRTIESPTTHEGLLQSSGQTLVDWTIESPTTHEGRLQSSGKTPSNAHRTMKIRRDLGRLADWRGPASAEAISVARAIEIAMDTLFPSESRGGNLTWSLVTRDKQYADFRLDIRDGKWKAYSDEIEAALSLWLFSVHQDKRDDQEKHREGLSASISDPGDDAWLRAKGSPAKRSLRLLGSYTQGLHRDLWWWMPSEATGIIKMVEDDDGLVNESDADIIEVERHRIVGHAPERRPASQKPGEQTRFKTRELMKPSFHSTDKHLGEGETAGALLAAASYGPLKLLYAQDMFSAFMWALAKTLTDPIKGGAEIRSADISGVDAWQSFTLRNDHLSTMAQNIHNTGLGSLDKIYLSIIPPLSAEQKLLHADAIVELARQHAKQHEQLQHWEQAGDSYLWLFRTASSFPEKSRIATKATAALMEYLRTVTLALELREDQRYEQRDIVQLEELRLTLEKELRSVGRGMLSSLMTLYEKQGRGWKCVPVQEARCGWVEDEGYPETFPEAFNHTELHRRFSRGLALYYELGEILKRDGVTCKPEGYP
ncbi:hypothetical protein B0I37DRAFT_152071 [Chaetomium sp. MPI-CAGE-AT-0009]|nr:hypothetical protein B0I37DRAFT_152071 [Chaetomium sp. MPI-CAGE-AT-0009]